MLHKSFLSKWNGRSKMKIETKRRKGMFMEKVKRIQELRRSNAATAIPSKKKYNRKRKHKNKIEN